jgi:hypothetical protein
LGRMSSSAACALGINARQAIRNGKRRSGVVLVDVFIIS